MYRLSIPIAGLVLLTASAVLHGVQTGRWRDPEVLSRAARRLDEVPKSFSGWTSRPVEISERQLTAAEAAGGVAAHYEPIDGRGAVNVMLLCGPFGPVAVHPPTVCFTGVGYRQLDEEKRVEVKDDAGTTLGTFWSTEFERPVDGVTERIRTWWGWTADGRWSAPGNPRIAFAGTPVLYKIYFTEAVSPDGPESGIPSFAKAFLPRLHGTVFASNQAATDQPASNQSGTDQATAGG